MFPRRWPPVRTGRDVLPGEIKSVSIAELCRLQDAANRASGVSATGRPQWIADHADDIERFFIAAFSIESPGWYRCVVAPLGGGRAMGLFSLGVSTRDFNSLPVIPWDEMAGLLHMLLLRLEPIPLDPDQAAAWRDLSDTE